MTNKAEIEEFLLRLNETGHQQIQGTVPCPNPTEESEYDFSEPSNVVAKINYANKGDHETFAEHYGCLPDPLQDPTPVIVGATLYESISDILAIGFMDYLDRNRTEGKMCLSGWECDDIMKAFRKQDWKRIKRYRDKYLLSKISKND